MFRTGTCMLTGRMLHNNRIVGMLSRLAENNPGVRGKYKIAAGIVFKRHLVATGVNSYKTHPMMWEFGKNKDSLFLHAEVDAIKNALRLISVDQLSKSDLYIVRVKRVDGEREWISGLAKPCRGCQRAIETFNLKNVHYTTDENTVETCACS